MTIPFVPRLRLAARYHVVRTRRRLTGLPALSSRVRGGIIQRGGVNPTLPMPRTEYFFLPSSPQGGGIMANGGLISRWKIDPEANATRLYDVAPLRGLRQYCPYPRANATRLYDVRIVRGSESDASSVNEIEKNAPSREAQIFIGPLPPRLAAAGGARFRPEGPVTCQPRATPWGSRNRAQTLPCKGRTS
jgi:hypothetical protein